VPEPLHPEPLLVEELAAWSERRAAGLAVSEHAGRAIVRLKWRECAEPRLRGVSLPAVGGVAASAGLSLMRLSPVSAMAVSDTLPAGKLTEIFSDGHIAAVDVSHGFLVLRLAGAQARAVLDGLTPLDLCEAAFGPRSVRRTQIASHGVAMHCTGADAFDLYVDRSYAWSLWQYLSRSLDGACG